MNKFNSRVKLPLLSLTLALLILASQSHGEIITYQQVVLAAEERPPYIASNLPEKGYVFELAAEAFKRVGYELDIEFYPMARATKLAQEGKVAGLLPIYYSKNMAEQLWFSDPFPGDSIGLLKKKTFPGTIIIDANANIIDNLRGLRQFQFGMVRGGPIADVLADVTFLSKQPALNDLQNIDKLMAERMDLAFIDKYTAGDLLVNSRPHLIGQLEFIYPPLLTKEFHVAFSKQGNQQVYEAFNRGLKMVKEDGTLNQIMAKHGFLIPQLPELERQKDVRLVLGTVNNPDMLLMQKLSPIFEAAHPHISIDWRILDESTLRQRLLSDLAISDGQFDVMTIGAYETPIWAKMGWLTPIQKLPDSYDLEDVMLPIREALSYKDKLYALPFNAESSVMYYRTDLFDAAGISMPANPSYVEVLAFAEALHQPENEKYGICLRGKGGWGENIALVSTMINTFGGRWFDQKWQPQLNTIEWERAVTTYIKLLGNYGPPNPTENGFIENLGLFAQGKCAMWIDATVAAGRLYNSEFSKFSEHTAVTKAPISKTVKGSQWLWTWSLAVPESSKYKTEALTFISWATSKEYIQLVSESEGMLTIPTGTRRSSYLSERYLKVAPFAKQVLNAIETADPNDATLLSTPYSGIQFVAIDEFPALGNQIGLLLEKVLRNELTIHQALEQGQRLVDVQMKASGYY